MEITKEFLRKIAKKAFPKRRVLKILKMRKEASTRDYYRLTLSANFSAIAMVLHDLDKDPEIVKRIMEATEVFSAYRINVPEIFDWFPEEQLMFVRDAGAVSLEDVCRGHGIKIYLPFYKKIIEDLLRIHWGPEPPDLSQKSPFLLQFTEAKFNDEFQFFLTHSGLQQKLSPDALEKITRFFHKVSASLCEEPFVLTHRDLHSRNIHVKEDQLFYIDHQDARRGPLQYDLISLIKDSYVDLSHKAETELITYYLEGAQKNWGKTLDTESFFRGYNLCLFQRSVKAAGTFFFQTRVRHHNKFQRYIPIVLSYALSVLHKLKVDPLEMEVLENELKLLLRESSH